MLIADDMVVMDKKPEIVRGKKWYAVYTRARAEKKVYRDLTVRDIEALLPIQKTLRHWSDRKKIVELPLFTSYVFVRIAPIEHDKVLQTYGAVKYVSFEGKAVSIPQIQIDNLLLLVNSDADIVPNCQHFELGQHVEVMMGSLKGLTGELIREGKRNRVLVRIDHLEQNLLVNIPKNYLQ